MNSLKKLMSNLTFWVLAFAVIGYLSSYFWGNSSWTIMDEPPAFYNFILLLKSIFLQLLKMMVAPMIFFSLLGGMLSIGSKAQLKEMGGSAVAYYISTTMIAIILGLSAVFFIHPWESSDPIATKKTESKIMESESYVRPKKYIENDGASVVKILHKTLLQALQNPAEAVVKNNVLGIAFSAFIIGLALILLTPAASTVSTFVNEVNQVISKVLGWVITTTPIGVFAITFDFQLKTGGAVIQQLLSFSLLVVAVTLAHGIIVLPLIAFIFTRINPFTLLKKMMRPLLVALTTSSSSATLPVTMQTCEEEFGVEKGVSGFVFPLGATMNMDGTALFEGIAAVFLAYLFGIELTTISIFLIFFMAMISSIGAPGMPSGSMAGMQIVLLSVGIPLEGIGLLLVVEKPLDAIRTAVNVEGDMIGALVVQSRMNKKIKS
jgi:Na+/H+-dicarboxylate symporter